MGRSGRSEKEDIRTSIKFRVKGFRGNLGKDVVLWQRKSAVACDCILLALVAGFVTRFSGSSGKSGKAGYYVQLVGDSQAVS